MAWYQKAQYSFAWNVLIINSHNHAPSVTLGTKNVIFIEYIFDSTLMKISTIKAGLLLDLSERSKLISSFLE